MLLDRVFHKLYYFLFLAVVLTNVRLTIQSSYSACGVRDNSIFSTFGVRLEPYLASHVRIRISNDFWGGVSLSLRFKAETPHGVIFFGAAEKRRYRNVAFMLRDGRLEFLASCTSNHLWLPLVGDRADDGKWHHAEFKIVNGIQHIYVDGRRQPFFYEVNCRIDYYEFGAALDSRFHDLHEGLINEGHFEGCIGSLSFSTGLRGQAFYNSTSSCQFK